MSKPRIGISSCLLGERVRHNGDHKRNDWLVNRLADHVTWVSACPEVAMGLGVPRETIHLEGKPGNPRLVTHKSRQDLTERAQITAERLLERMLDLDGYILKKDSPSCGLERVKVYGKNHIPTREGVGIFARHLVDRHPRLPKIEEGRLTDPIQREVFVTQIFALFRFKHIGPKISDLQSFHQKYKLLLMSFEPRGYLKLGQIAANAGSRKYPELVENYRTVLLDTLRQPVTARKRVNALQHMFGYFKNRIDSEEKKQILEVIEAYRLGETTLTAPLTLIHYLAKKHSVEFLKSQAIFEPYPKKLGLLA